MPHKDIYTIRAEMNFSTAKTVLQIKAGPVYGFEILSASVTQQGGVASAQEKIAIVRKTAAATVVGAFVGSSGPSNAIYMIDPGGPLPNIVIGSASGTGFNASAEGTDGDVPIQLGYNVLNGAYELPVPERRIYCRPNDIIALKFFTAPANQLWQFAMDIQEF